MDFAKCSCLGRKARSAGRHALTGGMGAAEVDAGSGRVNGAIDIASTRQLQ